MAGFSPDVQKAILEKNTMFWTPITIAEVGIFHVSFGAILGVSAWGRSAERVEHTKQTAETHRAIITQGNYISEPPVKN
jgi:hypothetical protein